MWIECQGHCDIPVLLFRNAHSHTGTLHLLQSGGNGFTSRKGRNKSVAIIMSVSNIQHVENVPASMNTQLCKRMSHKAVSHSLEAMFCSVCHSQESGRRRSKEGPDSWVSSPYRWTPVGVECSRERGLNTQEVWSFWFLIGWGTEVQEGS